MTEEVRVCVDAKLDSLVTYLEIPANVQPEFDDFCRRLAVFAEGFTGAQEFEAAFAQNELNTQFLSFYTKCTVKSTPMTKEQKKAALKTWGQMLEENSGDLAKEALTDIADTALLHAKSDMMTKNRERMIEEGTFDEYTRRSNRAEDAGNLLSRLFKK